MKSAPCYQLIFALDNETAYDLSVSTSRSMARKIPSERVCDRYYESSDLKSRAKTKAARCRQYRVRRINRTWDVSLESLNWERDMCSLRQTKVPSCDLARLRSDVVDKSWSGKWFHKKLVKLSLVPSLEIHFDAATWKHDSLDGEVRLTIDRNLQASSTECPFTSVQSVSNAPVELAFSVVRMEYSVSLPSIFKALIYEFALLPEQPTFLLDLAKARVLGTQPIQNDQINVATAAMESNREVATCQLG